MIHVLKNLEGYQTDIDDTVEIFNVDEAFNINSLDVILLKILKRNGHW